MMKPVVLALLLCAAASPAAAAVRQCTGEAKAANGAEAHAVLFIEDSGERVDGIIAWSPPVSSRSGLPFSLDLIYGLGDLKTGTFFDVASLSVTAEAPLSASVSKTMAVSMNTPTADTTIKRPWGAYAQALSAGAPSIKGTVTFSMGDGSDGLFYAINDKDPAITVKLVGDGNAIAGQGVFDLKDLAARDALVKQAFDAAGKLTANPRSCPAR